MLRLHVRDAADVFILSRQFPQPGTTFSLIARLRIEPEISYVMIRTDRYKNNPFQNIVAALFFPKSNVLRVCSGYEGAG